MISLGLVCFIHQFASADTSLPLPNIANYGGMVQNPGITSTSTVDFPTAAASLVVGLVLNVRYVILAVAIGLLIFGGFGMVTGQGDVAKWTTAKNSLVFSIIGLALVGLSGEVVRIFAVGNCAEMGLLPSGNNAGCAPGGILANTQTLVQRATLFNQEVQYLITFIKYLIGSLAVVSLMRNAARMATNTAGDELEKDKKNIVASLIGLVAIVLADPIINNVLFSVDKSRYPGTGGAVAGINYVQGISEIVGITNFLVTIMTPIAIIVIVAGGVMYMTAGNNTANQDKAKRMITLALVSLVLIYGAFAIVSTFISGEFNSTASTTNPAAATQTTTPVSNV